MARSLDEIFALAKSCRKKYLELNEFENSSKMSVFDAITWVSSACIWSLENIIDVFKVDLAKELKYRINGTPAYFANALLKYQSGYDLVINEDGTSFSYPKVDESKRIIKKVSYYEVAETGFKDSVLVLKVATGEPGNYCRIEENELMAIRAYLNKILFAGQHAIVVSRKGDILIPRLTVYYDGAVPASEVMTDVRKALNDFISSIDFDGVVYVQKIIDCIQKVDHVTDVGIKNDSDNQQGVYVVQYDDDNNIINASEDSIEYQVDRFFVPNSGYIRESTGTGDESQIPRWNETIEFVIDEANNVGQGVIGICSCPSDCECRQQ